MWEKSPFQVWGLGEGESPENSEVEGTKNLQGQDGPIEE